MKIIKITFHLYLLLFLIFFAANSLFSQPLCEGFTQTTFPPVNWSLQYTGELFWSRNSVSSYGIGVGSAKFDFYDAINGTTQSLFTYTFSPTTSTSDSLIFHNAYCTYLTQLDELHLYASTNNGNSWIELPIFMEYLITAPPQTSPFTPTANQWKKNRFSLPIGTNKLKFTCISAYGNNLYIDSICIVNTVGINPIAFLEPEEYSLSQNYPNPFNPTTTIQFNMPKAGKVEIKVFDILGREVATLVNEFKPVGVHSVNFNATNLSSGVYFYKMKSADFTVTKKMLLVK